MNYIGPLLGLLAFFAIGIFHPIVIKMEYHLGKRSWWILLFPGIIFIILSLFFKDILSVVFGVFGFACIWSMIEIFKQHERVMNGRAKKNPNRKYDEL
ncbi:MAG: DUF4491 family protein [Bacteroidetes bacterium]|nr:DUF4491 family protein [Bacteroidota bacterium]